MDELKPCPFCGRVPKLSDWIEYETVDEETFRRYCCDMCDGGCGAKGGAAHTIGEAAKNWNRRV